MSTQGFAGKCRANRFQPTLDLAPDTASGCNKHVDVASALDMRGGFRSFALNASQTCRDIGSRHSGGPETGVYSAPLRDRIEPEVPIPAASKNGGKAPSFTARSLADSMIAGPQEKQPRNLKTTHRHAACLVGSRLPEY